MLCIYPCLTLHDLALPSKHALHLILQDLYQLQMCSYHELQSVTLAVRHQIQAVGPTSLTPVGPEFLFLQVAPRTLSGSAPAVNEDYICPSLPPSEVSEEWDGDPSSEEKGVW